jgi:hypothetical protein
MFSIIAASGMQKQIDATSFLKSNRGALYLFEVACRVNIALITTEHDLSIELFLREKEIVTARMGLKRMFLSH